MSEEEVKETPELAEKKPRKKPVRKQPVPEDYRDYFVSSCSGDDELMVKVVNDKFGIKESEVRRVLSCMRYLGYKPVRE